jgi:oxygen-dependent protoporphyrinogen oxidase
VVLEAGGRAGGTIESVAREGFFFELGPAFLSSPVAADLAREVGLGGSLIEAAPVAARREVWTGKRLEPVPANPLDLLTTPLLSAGAKLRLLREPWASPPPPGEESVADFARRRLGSDAARLALSPLVAGLWAGDPERLSARYAFPELWEMERRHGSLLRGMRAESAGPSAMPWSFRTGLEELPRALALGLDVRFRAACRSITRSGGRYVVATEDEQWTAGGVVLACPAHATAELLSPATAGKSGRLAEIPYAPVAIVGIGVARDEVRHDLDSAGFLVPRDSGLRVLGCLFLSALFPERGARADATLVAVLGGTTEPAVARWSAARLIEATVEDLRRAVGLRGEPRVSVVRKLPRALPQYEVGHGRFLELIGEIEDELPGVLLAGSYRDGISLGDCLSRGETASRRLVEAAPRRPRRSRRANR